MMFFINEEIPLDTQLSFVFDLFLDVHVFYGKMLTSSIYSQVFANDLYYNYLLLDGSMLEEYFEDFKRRKENIIQAKDLAFFKHVCFYIGKGKNGRKFSHIIDGRKEFYKSKDFRSDSTKLGKICSIWKEGRGIAILQLHPETCHFEALSIEFAIIKAFGLDNLTNEINGTCYGAMQDWGINEVVNYGNLCLLKAFKLAFLDMPKIIYSKD